MDRILCSFSHPQLLICIGNLFLLGIISEIENNTCVKFNYVQTDIPSEAENNYTICYIPDFTQLLVNERK